jgi:hypothetical protein
MPLTVRFWKRLSIAIVASIATPTALLAAPAGANLADGIYLFGQSPKPETLGQEYLIFQVKQGKMAGAVFLPMSEFSCFTGTIAPGQINLSIRDPYENQVYRHSIALQPLAPVASGRPVRQNIGLEGYYPIEQISASDRQILQTCIQQMRD